MTQLRPELAAAANLEAEIMKTLGPLTHRMRQEILDAVRSGTASASRIREIFLQWDSITRTRAFRRSVARASARVMRITARKLKQLDPKSGPLALAVDAYPAGRIARNSQRFSRDQARLITRIGRRQRRAVAREVREAVRTGGSMRDLERSLGGILGPRDSRTRRALRNMAKNEVLTLSARVTRDRHEAAGIREAEWVTSDDVRVRAEHAANHRKTYRIGEGIDGIEPGDEIGCRCIARPVLPAHLRRKRG